MTYIYVFLYFNYSALIYSSHIEFLITKRLKYSNFLFNVSYDLHLYFNDIIILGTSSISFQYPTMHNQQCKVSRFESNYKNKKTKK